MWSARSRIRPECLLQQPPLLSFNSQPATSGFVSGVRLLDRGKVRMITDGLPLALLGLNGELREAVSLANTRPQASHCQWAAHEAPWC